MAIEFINGDNIAKLSYSEKNKVFVRVIDFLQSINVNDELTKKFSITRRKPIFYLITMPYITLRSIINFPRLSILIIRSFLYFCLKFQSIFKSKLVFSHRDIDVDNMIISKNKIYLLDFQYSAITCAEFDYVSVLRSIIGDDKFVNVFMKSVVDKRLDSKESKESFKVLSIYYALLGLIDLKFPKSRSLEFAKMLKYVLNIKI
jgi:hypothetical protein